MWRFCHFHFCPIFHKRPAKGKKGNKRRDHLKCWKQPNALISYACKGKNGIVFTLRWLLFPQKPLSFASTSKERSKIKWQKEPTDLTMLTWPATHEPKINRKQNPTERAKPHIEELCIFYISICPFESMENLEKHTSSSSHHLINYIRAQHP